MGPWERETWQTSRGLLAWDKMELMVPPETPSGMGEVKGDQTWRRTIRTC